MAGVFRGPSALLQTETDVSTLPMGLIDAIRRCFQKTPQLDPAEMEDLRTDFKDRYHNFKLLLNANQRCLEIMGEIEAALQGQSPFGMSFIRSRCTAASVNVFRMIQHLNALSHGKYTALSGPFDDIQQNIDRLLLPKPKTGDQRWTVPLEAVDGGMIDSVGGKMAGLGEVKNTVGLRTPEGFVITAAAYERFMEENDLQTEIDRLFQSVTAAESDKLYSLSTRVQQLVVSARVPPDIVRAATAALEDLAAKTGGPTALALRSSALGEDAAGSSFAGQYRSELNVSPDSLLTAYRQIVASKYSLQAIRYRLNRGFRDEDIGMCVGVMEMIDAVAGGVAYSRNPMDFTDDRIFINSAWGLPKSVVDGSVACDLFVVARQPPMAVVHRHVADKAHQFICYPDEGIRRIPLNSARSRAPSLESETILELAAVAVKLEARAAGARDIEWALSPDGNLSILQSRPLQPFGKDCPHYPDVPRREEETNLLFHGGITASPGAAWGPVYQVEKDVDMLQFPSGAVLVAREARPRWAALLDRAAAVVTEQGGFAGHLANVAREFSVPALFGLPDATENLANGDLITVDASRQRIFAGRMENLLQSVEIPVNRMKGSPVYELLVEISSWIVPLHLLDPDAPDFRPSRCRSLHDITRFIHEKAVGEMFAFGKAHDFSERAAKQLYYNVPMQWWLLNLDDGFFEEVQGKYVRLENICSIPMLAFWEGFTAIPWDGPPALDGKGLLSVMFQSTTQRGTDTRGAFPFADRNYFMISRHYCNLSSRLGYHFSIMEAYVGGTFRRKLRQFPVQGGGPPTRRADEAHLFYRGDPGKPRLFHPYPPGHAPGAPGRR